MSTMKECSTLCIIARIDWISWSGIVRNWGCAPRLQCNTNDIGSWLRVHKYRSWPRCLPLVFLRWNLGAQPPSQEAGSPGNAVATIIWPIVVEYNVVKTRCQSQRLGAWPSQRRKAIRRMPHCRNKAALGLTACSEMLTDLLTRSVANAIYYVPMVNIPDNNMWVRGTRKGMDDV